MTKKKFICFLVSTLSIFLILHIIGWWGKLYQTTACYDKLLHFLAGGCVFLAGWWLLELLSKGGKKRIMFKLLISFLILVLVSVSWEVFEFMTDKLFDFPILQESFNDTTWDLISDLGGGIVCALILYFPFKRKYSIIKML